MSKSAPSCRPTIRASRGLFASAVLMTGTASAQTALVAANAAGSGAGAGQMLEEITVTAEKREINLQNAPVAITAVSGASLEQSNITQMADLNGSVPGLTIAKSSGFERIVSIRGIGSETPENAFTTQPGVSFHVDGVYIANTISLDQSLFDVDHIEVSRGPQATVFGQASTGGSINLISRQPELDKVGGSIDVSAGNYQLYRSRGMLNLPIGETLALRGSVQVFGHEGFATDKDLPGFRLDDANDRSGKLALLWQPSEDFSATATGQIYHTNHHGAEQKNILDPNADPRVVSQDYPSYFRLDTQLFYLNLKWELPWAEAKSTSSFQVLNHHQQEDGSRLDQATLGFFDDVQAWNTFMHDVTQELSLASRSAGFLDWTVGGLYLHQTNHQYVYETSNVGGNPPPYLLYDNDSHVDRLSYSGYAQVTAHLAPQLRFTLGGRYNHDQYFGPSTSFGVTSTGTYSKGVPTGKAEIQYDLTADSMEYLSFTRGYKPGGVNGNSGAVAVPGMFQPEHINAVELGSKNRLLDNTLIVDTAAYYYDYQNMQYLAVDPVPYHYGVDNIPTAHIYGLEVESSYLTLQNRLRINGNVSLSHSELVGNFHTLDATAAQNLINSIAACQYGGAYYNPQCWSQMIAGSPNTNGNAVPKLPKVEGSLNAGYTAGFGGYQLLSRLEFIYRGGFQYRIFNDGALDRVPSYDQWNLYFELTPPTQNLTCSLTVSNVFNKDGINSRYTDPYGVGQTSNEYIPPRQVIGTIAYRF
jgi:iron complex outermembrane recepter protein